MKRKVLGKGLDLLIPESSRESGDELLMVDVGALTPSPFQPRRRIDRDAISSLARSIKESGILNPLLVRRRSGGLELIAGERRLEAAKEAGLEQVPVLVLDVSDEKALELALVENIQREDLNPIDEAEAYQQLIKQFGLKQEEVANRVGKERSTVTNMLRLLKLPDPVKDRVRSGEISMGHARALLSAPGEQAQVSLSRRIVRDGLSVRQVENLLSRSSVKKKGPKKSQPKRHSDPNIRKAEETLEKKFQTRVRIVGSGAKGRVELHYFSAEELDRLYAMLIKAGS